MTAPPGRPLAPLLPADLGFALSPNMDRTLRLAMWITDAADQDVNVNYASLLVAMAWSDGPAGRWLSSLEGFDPTPVLASLRLKPQQRVDIEEPWRADGVPELKADVLSRSVRALLDEAAGLARHVTPRKGPPVLEERHVLGAYLFRNPPAHDQQLWKEWGFDPVEWRRAFAGFVQSDAPEEAEAWNSVFRGHEEGSESAVFEGRVDEPDGGSVDEPDGADGGREGDPDQVPASMLESYPVDDEANRVVVTMERAAASLSGSSEAERAVDVTHLFRALVAAAEVFPDLAPLAGLPAHGSSSTSPNYLLDVPELSESGTPGNGALGLAPALWAVMTRARELARDVSGNDTVGVRHLLAVLLVEDAAAGSAGLRDAQVVATVASMRGAALATWTARHVNDRGGVWRGYLVGTTPATVAGFDADGADEGQDQLDVTRYATAFASIVAAEAVDPPLSIGVFGDWGSGKSFFMRLLRDETERLAAIDVPGPDGRPLFHRNVVPILFNAWHYVDANLWASLVQAILQGMHDAMVGAGDEALMDEVLDRLELAKEAKVQAARAVEQAEADLEERQAEEAAARRKAAAEGEELRKVRGQDLTEKIRTHLVEGVSLTGLLKFAAEYADLPDDEMQALRRLEGLVDKPLGELKEVVAEGRATALRGRSAVEWLARAPLHYVHVAALAGVVVVGAGAVWALDAFVESQVPAITTVFVEVGAAVGMVVAWVRSRLQQVGKGLDHFDRVRVRVVEEETAVRAEHEQAVAEAEGRVEDAERMLERRRAELLEARDRLAQAERELRESGSVRRIARLVERRLEGQDYERHLGIVAAIRSDFETISRYMAQRAGDSEAAPGLKPVDRIVLYIDDLDRCPTDKVVAVLEAIHLLLAFKLFVVVVGVDIRWAARSLKDKYPRHLMASHFEVLDDGDPGGARVAVATEGASALDYLEKIFQIPFWLPPLDTDASRNMISAMVPRASRAQGDGTGGGDERDACDTAGSTRAEGGGGSGPASSGEGGRDASEADGLGPGREGAGNGNGTAGPGSATDGASETDAGPGPDGVAPSDGATAEGRAAEAARLLSIEDEERNLMLLLAGAVGKSPRRLKRFVNTYRILKASLNALDRMRFVGDDGRSGEYGAAMALMAALTASPREGIELLHHLTTMDADAPLTDLTAHVAGLPASPDRAYIQAALTTYREWTGKDDPTVRDLRTWAPEVARFSFRSGNL